MTASPALPACLQPRLWLAGAGLLALAALLVQPLAAQELDTAPELEALIPDDALADPESWAAQGVAQADAGGAEAAVDPLAEADMAELERELAAAQEQEQDQADPLLSLETPADLVLPAVAPLEPDAPVDFVTFADVVPPLPPGAEMRVSDELVLVFPTETALFPIRDQFIERFTRLSVVEDLADDGNQARLAAQARADEGLLQRMLRVYGYFDAQVIRSVVPPEARADGTEGQAVARFEVIPGRRYTVGTVDLGQLDQARAEDVFNVTAAYKVKAGDLLAIDAIADGRDQVDVELGERGYPFAVVGQPALMVDHARAEGDVTLPVEPGGRYVFGAVTSNMEQFLSSRHLADIARFDAGDLYQRSMEMDLRRAILATGLVGSVTLTPVEVAAPQGDQPGTVDLAVALTRAPLRTLAGSLGYGTEEGFRAAASWEHRNLIRPEGMLRLRGVAGTQEQLAGATLRFNNFHGRDQILTIDTYASTQQRELYVADTVSLLASFEQASTLLFQKAISYGLGLELVATNEQERDANGVMGPGETYLIAALPGYAQWDTSDSLLDPTKGFRLRGALSPEYSRTDNAEAFYLKSQVDFAYYHTLDNGVVLAGRTRLGSIVGADLDAIAPSRRFYAGGGGSVRGYGYQAIGPRDVAGAPNGGRSLVELSVEARVPTGLLDGAVDVVPFFDLGSVARSSTPDFGALRMGAGVGARYNTSFGPIRVDVGVPLNRQPGDAPVALYVALGQAF